MYDYSTVNKENLQKLHDFCPHITNLCMIEFADDSADALHATPSHPCKTAACLAGNGPSAGVPVQREHVFELAHKQDGDVDWFAYIRSNFIDDDFGDLSHFAFGSEWPDCTKEAQARLTLVLDEQVPEKWSYLDRFAEGV